MTLDRTIPNDILADPNSNRPLPENRMRKIIDVECDLPPDEHGRPRKFETTTLIQGYGDPERMEPRPDYGFANYGRIFRGRAPQPEGAPRVTTGMSLDEFVARMDDAGVVTGVVGRVANEELGRIVKRYPGRFLGLASISPFDGMRGVRAFEHAVRDFGLHGLRIAALFNMIPASDRRYYPLYAKCVELDVPVRIYTSMNYANDRPYDLGHPRHLDQVAMDFPELRIIAGLGGWPWVADMVGLLRRHPNLYCDTAAHHPRYFAQAGSGWEQFLQFGNTLLQDKIMVGISLGSVGIPYKESIALYEALPLKDQVIEKWLYGNARDFFRLD
jgi:predicted TIM-barrel fold metal-dependent hydrolase